MDEDVRGQVVPAEAQAGRRHLRAPGRRRGRDGNRRSANDPFGGGEDGPPALRSALLGDEEEVTPCVGEDGCINESSFRAAAPSTSSSGFSKLEDPLSLREALWSSTVPRETLDDIKRLGVQGSFGRMGRQGGGRGGLLEGGNGIDINLTSMNNAERI